MRRCVVLAFGVLALGQTPNVVMDHPLHFDVNLVQVDVVVEDRSGQRPDDLNANDFEVRQDGKPQQITHFLFVPRAQSASPDAGESATGANRGSADFPAFRG
jgi:hypothetical protein